MNGRFEFIDHTADIAFKAEGESLEALFEASAVAWRAAVVNAEPAPAAKKEIELRAAELEILLASFLDEINFLFFSRQWLFDEVEKLEIKDNGEKVLSAVLKGHDTSGSGIEVKEEIKAVTFHKMEINYINGGYHTFVVFDV